MLHLKIYDSAGPTTGFWYDTGDWAPVRNSESLVVNRSTIKSGPLAGKEILQKWFGSFDTLTGETYSVSRTLLQVDGILHLGVTFDPGFRNTEAEWKKAYLDGIAYSGNASANFLAAGDGNDALFGLGGQDTLEGYNGNDTLDGGGGADYMRGGTGDDVYVIDNRKDRVVEAQYDGTDSVIAHISYRLGFGLENLTLAGSSGLRGIGNDVANRIAGNAGANRIEGRAGDDTLLGGAGADTLIGGDGLDRMLGGAGDDVYVVGETGDRVIEAADGGTDLVRSSVSFTLSKVLENLTLVGSDDIRGIGNGRANEIRGNDGNNLLRGYGSADTLIGGGGADTLDGGGRADRMSGGAGDDVYHVDSRGDVLLERSDGGTDTVVTGLSWALGAQIENLDLTGRADLRGTGNALDNVLTGNGGNNRLRGLDGADTLVGGKGADTLDGGLGGDVMQGGEGSDLYLVERSGDVVSDDGVKGRDTVRSSVNFTLPDNVEVLELVGTGDTSGIGNSGNNRLEGNAGGNYLSGGLGRDTIVGGRGDDVMSGGEDRDVFLFRSAAEVSVKSGDAMISDVIEDFTPDIDLIDLSAIDANLNRAGNQAFDFIGSDAFSGHARELRYFGNIISGDQNGDGVADFELILASSPTLDGEDFVL